MVSIVHCLISISLVVQVVVAQELPALIKGRTIPAEFDGAYEFLELIKYPQEPDGVFDPQKAPHWNVDRIMSFISPRGIDYSDVNRPRRVHLRYNDIRQHITKRKGLAFEILSHLAHIYSVPYKQYSELTFRRDKDKYIIDIASWYTLTYVNTNDQFHLVCIDYNTLEGD